MSRPAAVFFDVDFTLIYPGPTFQGEGYARFCARHGIAVDQRRWNREHHHAQQTNGSNAYDHKREKGTYFHRGLQSTKAFFNLLIIKLCIQGM